MYKIINYLNKPTCIHRLVDGALIPFDPANMDFVEYNKWLSQGNTPLPPDAE